MNKVILSWKDFQTLLSWHKENKNLVSSFPQPLKNVSIIIKDKGMDWQGEINRKNDKVKIHHVINGMNHGTQVWRIGKNPRIEKDKTDLDGPDKLTIYYAYTSLMAFMVYAKDRTEKIIRKAAIHRPGIPRKAGEGYTYIFRRAGTGTPQEGHHRSPEGVFTVRGHYRKYKTGKTIWIKEYKKGTGRELERTYKL